MAWALGLAAAYMLAEIVGGIVANSLALLADAGHMATDVAALGLALWAMRLAQRPPTSSTVSASCCSRVAERRV
jgi:cobalt-zinc-cadmium efflux system protein